MRSSTVQRLSKIALKRIEQYCLENNCGWIFRYNGEEFGARIINGKLDMNAEFFKIVLIPISKVYIRKG